LHDWLVARQLERLKDEIDIVHVWPLGARRTLQEAARLGIPTVLERANAHTRYAYESVKRECELIGVALPPNHEHAFNAEILRHEEIEYKLADRLLCPSEFTLKTFLDEGYPRDQLARHIYGYDETLYYPASDKQTNEKRGLTMLFVGVCAVRKGLHFALEAWLKSPASEDGTFLIAGEFLPAYQTKLAPLLAHPSVRVLGHRRDVPDLMRAADILVLPSIEEGFGLVCTDAIGSLCVPLVSEACTDLCRHMKNSLVHRIADVGTLTQHISLIHADRGLLQRLQEGCRETAPSVTWTAAGIVLADVYKQVISQQRAKVA
jgi:glycosyltransferase involved in cell wall biosynthesis